MTTAPHSSTLWEALFVNTAAATTVADGKANGWHHMAFGPAPINWCEEDYAVYDGIAEFWVFDHSYFLP
jgi:hypothetical protein